MKNNDPFTSMYKFIDDSCAVINDGIELVVSRFEKNKDHPFIDTKLSTLDGSNFESAADIESDFRGPTAIFGWIQGRGLEALASHAVFLQNSNPSLTQRCDQMLYKVGEKVAEFGKLNQGRFAFLSTPDGRPFRCGADGKREYFSTAGTPSSITDFFTGKGLVAAGVRCSRNSWKSMGIATFNAAMAAARKGRFVSDQISFDPKNPVRSVPGRRSQGPWMLSLGGFALFTELCPQDGDWLADGCEAVRWLLERHVVAEDSGKLKKYDFSEFTTEDGKPWFDGDKVYQDPGHAIEFTGLGARFLLFAEATGNLSASQKELLERCREWMPEVFLSAFKNGFNHNAGGICKLFDLTTNKPINDDMPWWPLPEAMRAAALLIQLAPEHPRKAELASAAALCADALYGKFRSPVPGLFVQTRNVEGNAVPVVPATPDADPGYHTGLCLIDFVNACRSLQSN